MNVATYLASFLKSQNITHIFGLPGGENVPIMEALRETGIDYVLVHHEAAAGFAADVTGQLTDKPGVCLSTVGPGAINLLATTASATLERSPVLAITAEIDATEHPGVTHMNLDLVALFRTGTKGSFSVTAETAVTDIHTAWHLALTPPRGAVHLAISPEVAMHSLPDNPRLPKYPPAQVFDAAQIEPAIPLVQAAERPFLLAGLGVEAAQAQAALTALADAWQVPVAVTAKAKGHFPESHPLFTGCFTAYGDQSLRHALAEADLVIGAGLDGVDFVTSTWDIDTPVINLNLAQADDPVFRPAVAIDGDLPLMLAALRPYRQPNPEGPAFAAALRQAIDQALRTSVTNAPGTIKLHDLITALRTATTTETAVTVDVGAFKLVFLQQWQTDLPKSLFVANGLSAMGYALPGAMAIKLAQPDRPVVAVVGDGALLMYAGELATVARLGRPLVILVVVDEALSLIRLKQIRQGVPIHGTEFGRTDFQSLAQAFGLGYCLIDGKQNASDIFRAALRRDQPVLVEARINKSEYDHFR